MTGLAQIILLVAGAQGVLLSVALVVSGWQKKKPSVYFGVVLSVLAIELLNAWAMTIDYHSNVEAFPFWTIGSYLLLPPALFLFLQSGFNPNFKPNKHHLRYFLPALAEILIEFSAFYGLKFTGQRPIFLRSTLWFLLTEILPILATIVVLGVSAYQLKKSVIKTQQKQLGFILVFTLLVILWIIDSLLQVAVYHVIEILLCALLFTFGYIIYFKPAFFDVAVQEKTKVPIHQFAHYDDEQASAKLKHLFEEGKIYLKSRLTVEDVGRQLNLPHRYVSYLINHVFHTSFSDFVNTYRVNEVVLQLRDQGAQHKNLLGIALDAGFSSKSSFNQIFKNITGETPSAYLAKSKTHPKY